MDKDKQLVKKYIDENNLNTDSDLLSIITRLITMPVQYSDILIHEDSPIYLRMSRGWVEVPLGEIFRGKIEEFFSSMDNKWQSKLQPDGNSFDGNSASGKLNFSRDMDKARIRCNGFIHGDGKLGMAIRRIPKEIPKLAEIGIPLGVADALNRNRGLILITGPVGNGKSTTMAAMLGYINNLRCGHILTLEDPLEFVHTNTKSIFTQREIPKHAKTFREGFKEALRERPDVIAIGELRDKDTIETCLEGADAGLLMIATMHANNASSAINKFLGFYSDFESKQKAAQLAESLIAVVSQTLVPSCVEGRNGSELAYEVLVNNSQVRQQIAAQQTDKIKDLLSLDPTPGSRLKSNTLNSCLLNLVNQGLVNRVDAINYSYDPMDLEKELNKPKRI